MENQIIINRAAEIVAQTADGGKNNYATLIYLDSDGSPVGTTISISKADGIRWLTFCTGVGAPAPTRIVQCGKCSVCLNSPEYHIRLTGTAQVLTDLETKREMWYAGLENHFSGPEDPNLCVIKLTTQRYSLFVDWQDVKGTL